MYKQKKSNERQNTYRKGIGLFFLALLIVYAAGAFFFSSRFLPGTEFPGVKTGGKTAEEAKELIKEHWNSYVLTLEKREDKTEEIKASDIGITVDLGDGVETAQKAQSAFLWPVSVFLNQEINVDMKLSYEEALLTEAISGLECMDESGMKKPVNAKIEPAADGFAVVKEELGTVIRKNRMEEAVKEALLAGEERLNLEEAGCYENPEICSEGELVKKAVARIDELRSVVVTYDFDYAKETVDKTLIDQWILVDEKMNVSLDYEKVLDYIEELAAEYDTYATVRDFKNSYGKDIQILFGAYGWKISQTKETRALMEVIEKGESGDREPIYLYRAQCRKEGNIDWDDTYAEVSISGQHMWFYKDGECVVSTDVVTGDVVRPGRKTPTGAYGLLYKIKDQVLVGEDYESGVKYWMPFDTNVGFHDASWRKPEEFGKETYKGNGSHGCVNMPEEAAAKLYQYIEPGCPVFVY